MSVGRTVEGNKKKFFVAGTHYDADKDSNSVPPLFYKVADRFSRRVRPNSVIDKEDVRQSILFELIKTYRKNNCKEMSIKYWNRIGKNVFIFETTRFTPWFTLDKNSANQFFNAASTSDKSNVRPAILNLFKIRPCNYELVADVFFNYDFERFNLSDKDKEFLMLRAHHCPEYLSKLYGISRRSVERRQKQIIKRCHEL